MTVKDLPPYNVLIRSEVQDYCIGNFIKWARGGALGGLQKFADTYFMGDRLDKTIFIEGVHLVQICLFCALFLVFWNL